MKTKLTSVMRDQLIEYCYEAKEVGWYWGNQKQFWARHEKIVKWIREQEAKR